MCVRVLLSDDLFLCFSEPLFVLIEISHLVFNVAPALFGVLCSFKFKFNFICIEIKQMNLQEIKFLQYIYTL